MNDDANWGRGAARQAGSATIEFALVCAVYLLLLLAIVEFGILLWVNLTMQHAVREGARYAVTGQSNLDPNRSSPQRYNAVLQDIKDQSMGLYGIVNPTVEVSINGGSATAYGDPSLYNNAMFGGPGDIVELKLNCAWPILTPLVEPFFAGTGGQYRFSVAATMRNEAF